MNTKHNTWLLGLFALAILVAPTLGVAKDGEKDKPRREPPGDRRGQMLERFENALDEIELSEEQRDEIDAILAAAQERVREAAAGNDRQAVRETVESMRNDIAAVLSDEQKRALREKMRESIRKAMRDRPGRAPAAAPGGRLREAIGRLDLTDEQKEQVRPILESAGEKLRELRGDATLEPGEKRERAGEIVTEARNDLTALLDDEQKDKLKQFLEERPRRGDRGDGPPRDDRRRKRPRDEGAQSQALIGETAPNVELTTLGGRAVQLSSLQNKPVVLMFGSYTCPAFREQVDDFNRLDDDFRRQAHVYVVYTREAHPAGGWEVERNRDAGITLDPHADLDQRRDVAEKAARELGLKADVIVDAMNDELAEAFAGFPNGAVIIDRQGEIAFHQRWANADRLTRELEQLLRN